VRVPHLSPTTLTTDEQRLILRATAGNVRDLTIISLALGTGLRLAYTPCMVDPTTDPWSLHRSLRFRRDVIPTIALLDVATDALTRATTADDRRQQLYAGVAAITFSAFAVESFLNLIGDTRVERWLDMERSATPAAKLAIIELALGFTADRSRLPFGALTELFRFRNEIVHAKPDSLPATTVPDTSQPIPVSTITTPLAYWEKAAGLDNARLLVDQAREMIRVLSEQSGITLPTDNHATMLVFFNPDWRENGPLGS
jgi:hypothetical protein